MSKFFALVLLSTVALFTATPQVEAALPEILYVPQQFPCPQGYEQTQDIALAIKPLGSK
jgi:hypothetical protein